MVWHRLAFLLDYLNKMQKIVIQSRLNFDKKNNEKPKKVLKSRGLFNIMAEDPFVNWVNSDLPD